MPDVPVLEVEAGCVVPGDPMPPEGDVSPCVPKFRKTAGSSTGSACGVVVLAITGEAAATEEDFVACSSGRFPMAWLRSMARARRTTTRGINLIPIAI